MVGTCLSAIAMSDYHPTTGLLQRCALGLWFCALAALGLLRYFMGHSRHPEHAADTVMRLWLGGSILLGLVGVYLLVRALKSRN